MTQEEIVKAVNLEEEESLVVSSVVSEKLFCVVENTAGFWVEGWYKGNTGTWGRNEVENQGSLQIAMTAYMRLIAKHAETVE